LDARRLENRLERVGEFGVTIHQQLFFASLEPVAGITQIAGDLKHPAIVGILCAARQLNSTGSQFHHKQ
jgi:hypothetical protein